MSRWVVAAQKPGPPEAPRSIDRWKVILGWARSAANASSRARIVWFQNADDEMSTPGNAGRHEQLT